MAEFETGDILEGRFEIAGVIGRGGMATVYLATDRLRGERIALKVLHEHLANTPSMRARLRREVVASGRIRHPNALVALDIHEVGGRLALSMPFHPGRTLDDYVAANPNLDAHTLVRLGTGLAEALAEAHRRGIVHRDVTPSNILIDDDGNGVLTDFGLARLEDFRTATATGAMGTTGYAAPEIYEGQRADPRSDIYSLGAVLYLAATGKPAFDAPTPLGILEQQNAEAFAPVATCRPDLPEPVCQLIESMLARDPKARPQVASEVVHALRAGMSREGRHAREDADIRSARSPKEAEGREAREGAGSGGPSAGARPGVVRNPALPASSRLEKTKAGGPPAPPPGPPRVERLPLPREPVEPRDQAESPLAMRALPKGSWTVVIREHPKDRHRRMKARRKHRRRRARHRRRRSRLETQIGPVVDDIWEGVKTLLAIPDTEGPEAALARAVAREGGLPDDALMIPPAMFVRRFRLVSDVDLVCAERLKKAALDWGFVTELHNVGSGDDPGEVSRTLGGYWALLAGLVVMILASELGTMGAIAFVIAALLVVMVVRGPKPRFSSRNLPLAFAHDLRPYLSEKYRQRAPAQLAAPGEIASERHEALPLSREKAPPAPRGATPDREVPADNAGDASRQATQAVDGDGEENPVRDVIRRTRGQLDGLERQLEERRDDLPQVVVAELSGTISALRGQVTVLGCEAERLHRRLVDTDDDAEATAASRIEARIQRIQTLKRAGEPVDDEELEKLESGLAAHRQALESVEAWESQSTLLLARLLEIGSAARQAMIDLASARSRRETSSRLLERLREESSAAAHALEEVNRLQATGRASQVPAGRSVQAAEDHKAGLVAARQPDRR